MCKEATHDQGEIFGAWFQQSREIAGLTRQQLADQAKISVEEIILIEECGAATKLGHGALTKLVLLLRLPE